MTLSTKELKRLAKMTLLDRYSIPLAAYLLTGFIPLLLLIPFFNFSAKHNNMFADTIYLLSSLFISLLSGILSSGMLKLLLSMIRKQSFQIGDIFYCFRHHPDRYIIVTFLTTLPTFTINLISVFSFYFTGGLENLTLYYSLQILFTILQTLISLIVFLYFGLTIFLLIDHPELKPLEALKESSRLLKGNKGQLFFLILSFLGMFLLGYLSFGIGLLWVYPYYLTTLALFYLDITQQLYPFDITI